MTRTPRGLRFWLVTAAALFVAAGTFSLGQWQLRRAAQKIALQSAIEAQGKLPLLDNRALTALPDIAGAVNRQATLNGEWQAGHTVFLDNRPMSGKTGFIVVTPLVLAGSTQVILVQRGWVQRDFVDRTRLPPIATPSGPVAVQGRIVPPPSKLYEFKGVEQGRIRQNIDLPAFAGEIGLPLIGVSVLQSGSSDEGLLREWPAASFGVERHYGYAFQWFALCALVVALYAWFQLFKSLLDASRRKEDI